VFWILAGVMLIGGVLARTQNMKSKA
jgi:hypothetical protein